MNAAALRAGVLAVGLLLAWRIVQVNVVLYDDCVIGDRVIVHPGARIGQDGMGPDPPGLDGSGVGPRMRTPGVEPGPLAGQDPKSCASAGSATFATAGI